MGNLTWADTSHTVYQIAYQKIDPPRYSQLTVLTDWMTSDGASAAIFQIALIVCPCLQHNARHDTHTKSPPLNRGGFLLPGGAGIKRPDSGRFYFV